MERFRYGITKIKKKKWREYRRFCVSCEYYRRGYKEVIKSVRMNLKV